MARCWKTGSLPLKVLGALLAILTLATAGQAQQKKKNPKPSADKAAQQKLMTEEAQALVRAYILLAGADQDYKGHRVKAMGQVQHAIEVLDKSILKNSTKGKKVVALKGDIAAARAKFIAKHSATVHEPQALSDLQMRAAIVIIAKVGDVAAQNKQKRVASHLKQALKQIDLALKGH
jgi:hypothetical protein